MDSVQLNRRANLHTVIQELAEDGITGETTRATVLGTTQHLLMGMLRGEPISKDFAREVEWVMQRRTGWMDEDHGRNRLD
jgi:hypothetical protein